LLEKTQLDNISSIATVKEEGLKQGIKEGLEKGKKQCERNKIKELELNMKNQILENDFIAKYLNISINDLNLLLNSK
jgi:flagellar biosynthesis/type III secretory pathway protein FliH